ncbi:MAG: paraquat-inducible protein A [Paracoccaceae bacterium]
MENAGTPPGALTARGQGLIACHRCGRVHARTARVCLRCHGPIASRDTASLQRVWAWLLAGLIAYVPANVYPMLLTSTLFERQESTILGGVVELFRHGSWGVATIVFVASIVIPVGKFLAIGWLALSLKRPRVISEHAQHRLLEVVEFVGRWSMIDVFVVAILASLVRFDAVATINPGIAAVSFALSVAFTMLSALSFDSRLIWDE